ncbi:prolyl oligopeptidase family serine peptidase [Kutzneria sp. NPDC052558]|uniref:prolyl oligopeptidase family serine peptidase n=1 Tax=Kutzneria sp. NPDC052558 TaxID=3364121 RepID=UPI0037C87E7B
MTQPQIRVAASIAHSDISTSIVLSGSRAPQVSAKGIDLTAHLNVPFARRPNRSLLLDLLVPPGSGPKPLIVYITGGGFIRAEKENGRLLRTCLAVAGFAVASIQYLTVWEGATYLDGVASVREAVAFLRSNAATYDLDPTRVALLGESAGGYLATMAGLDPANAVRAVVNKFGIVDFGSITEDFDSKTQASQTGPDLPLALYLHGEGTGRTVHDPIPDASPLNHITPSSPPFQLWHGLADGIISPSQTLRLHTALRSAGVDSTRYVLPGAGHGDVAILLGDPEGALPWYTEEVIGLTTDFFRTHLLS